MRLNTAFSGAWRFQVWIEPALWIFLKVVMVIGSVSLSGFTFGKSLRCRQQAGCEEGRIQTDFAKVQIVTEKVEKNRKCVVFPNGAYGTRVWGGGGDTSGRRHPIG